MRVNIEPAMLEAGGDPAKLARAAWTGDGGGHSQQEWHRPAEDSADAGDRAATPALQRLPRRLPADLDVEAFDHLDGRSSHAQRVQGRVVVSHQLEAHAMPPGCWNRVVINREPSQMKTWDSFLLQALFSKSLNFSLRSLMSPSAAVLLANSSIKPRRCWVCIKIRQRSICSF